MIKLHRKPSRPYVTIEAGKGFFPLGMPALESERDILWTRLAEHSSITLALTRMVLLVSQRALGYESLVRDQLARDVQPSKVVWK